MSALFCVWARTGGLILSTVLPSLAPRPPGRQGPWRRQYRTEASVHVWAPFILSSCSQGWTVMDCEQMALPCFFRPWNRMASVMLFEWWGLKLIQRLQIHLYNVDFGINYAELKKTRRKIPTHTWDNLRHFQNHQSRRFSCCRRKQIHKSQKHLQARAVRARLPFYEPVPLAQRNHCVWSSVALHLRLCLCVEVSDCTFPSDEEAHGDVARPCIWAVTGGFSHRGWRHRILGTWKSGKGLVVGFTNEGFSRMCIICQSLGLHQGKLRTKAPLGVTGESLIGMGVSRYHSLYGLLRSQAWKYLLWAFLSNFTWKWILGPERKKQGIGSNLRCVVQTLTGQRQTQARSACLQEPCPLLKGKPLATSWKPVFLSVSAWPRSHHPGGIL